MRAVTVSAAGPAEVMSWNEIDDLPPPGPGRVLIDVAATAVNRADVLQRQGFYAPPPGASEIIGMECSGRVAALGPGVTDWAVGDEVCALLAGGGYASRVEVAAAHVLPVPAGLSLLEAAALPEVACTVYSTVFGIGALRDGETFLVHGGASGIGTFAIQAVRACRPASMIAATAGTAAKLERIGALGADVAVSYRDDDFVARVREATDGRGADLILDNMGGSYLERNVEALATDGRLVIIGLQGGRKGTLNIGTLLPKRGAVHAASLRHRPDSQKAEIVAGTRDLFWPHLTAGRIRPVIDRVLPIEKVADAHRALEDLQHVGKIVLSVSGG
jgi:putative PIG3 family NAD(P)H quinone oxidoreductase